MIKKGRERDGSLACLCVCVGVKIRGKKKVYLRKGKRVGVVLEHLWLGYVRICAICTWGVGE